MQLNLTHKPYKLKIVENNSSINYQLQVLQNLPGKWNKAFLFK